MKLEMVQTGMVSKSTHLLSSRLKPWVALLRGDKGRCLCDSGVERRGDGVRLEGGSVITTPLFYASGPPHIGHLYSALIADAAHRWPQLAHPHAPAALLVSWKWLDEDVHHQLSNSSTASGPPHIGHLYSALIADAAHRWHQLAHPHAPVSLLVSWKWLDEDVHHQLSNSSTASGPPHIGHLYSALIADAAHRCWKWLDEDVHHQLSNSSTASGPPHIGHLYSALIADAAHRWYQLAHPHAPASLLVGTDEHGVKIARAAADAGQRPADFCDAISRDYDRLFRRFGVDATHSVRTSSERHKEAVQYVWSWDTKYVNSLLLVLKRELRRRGYLEKGRYSGWYSVADEAFYSPSQVQTIQKDGASLKVSKETGRPVEWVEEDTYVFIITRLKPRLEEWLTTQDVLEPRSLVSSVLHWLSGLRDPSVSREASRVGWGIPVPEDPDHLVYVWLDALVGYLSGLGYPHQLAAWPPTAHIIGKDILTFHAVLWPAILMALEIPLPRRIFVHSHWQVDKVKMSKSIGNVVDPFEEADVIGDEALRYVLLRQGVPQRDGSYTRETATDLVNNELANTVGNLLSRSLAPAINPRTLFPSYQPHIYQSLVQQGGIDLLGKAFDTTDIVAEDYDRLRFYKGLEKVGELGRVANAFVHHHAPWKLVKEGEEGKAKADVVIHAVLETLRVTATLLVPIVPQLSRALFDALRTETGLQSLEAARRHIPHPPQPQLTPLSRPLFQRLATSKRGSS